MSSLAHISRVVASSDDLQRRAATRCRQSTSSSYTRRSSRHVWGCVHAASFRFHRHSTLSRCCQKSRGTETQKREQSRRRKRGKEHNAPRCFKYILPLAISPWQRAVQTWKGISKEHRHIRGAVLVDLCALFRGCCKGPKSGKQASTDL